jgi:hypothetical protein
MNMREQLDDLRQTVFETSEGSHCSAVFGTNNYAHVKFSAGTDIGEILEGLPNDHCQYPHWGYLLKGKLVVSCGDRSWEKVRTGDVFYWPPGHSVAYLEDSELIEFSPGEEMQEVLEHIQNKLNS